MLSIYASAGPVAPVADDTPTCADNKVSAVNREGISSSSLLVRPSYLEAVKDDLIRKLRRTKAAKIKK